MLKVHNLYYGVKEREILKGADLEVEAGEFVGLIGPNGSGKSTLLKNICQELTPRKGTVSLMDEDLLDMTTRELARNLAVVSQEQTFNFTVEKVIRMGCRTRKGLLEAKDAENRVLVEKILDQTGLLPIRQQPFLSLSGGEKQRVLVARALVQDTPFLILDGPTSQLDLRSQLELVELVKSMGRTVLAAIHDLNIAARYCDRLYAIKDGQIVASGPPERILTPELIRSLYEVEAKVCRDEYGIFIRICGTGRE